MSLKLNSSGGGSVTLQEPVTASTLTLNLPAFSGTVANLAAVTNNGVLYVNSSGQPTSGSALTFDGTNLGVGTASPSGYGATLVSQRTTDGLVLTGVRFDGTNNPRLEVGMDSNGSYLNATSSSGGNFSQLRVNISSTERMRLTSTGLGIGTSSPGQKLEVAGNISINTSGNPFLQVRTSGSGNNPYIRLQADTLTWDIQGTFSNAGDELYFLYGGAARSYINSSTGAYVAVSDQRLKKNITDISYGLSAVMALRPVEYLMNDEADDAQKHLGFIAQEAMEVVPSSVSQMTGDTYGMDKVEIVAVLVKAIQELKAEFDAYKATHP